MTQANLNHGFDYTANPEWAVLGLGGTFAIPPAFQTAPAIWYKFSGAASWNYGTIANHRQSNVIYAYPVTWTITAQNRHNVVLHNPQAVIAQLPEAPAPPPNTPELWDDDDDEDEAANEEEPLTEEEIIAQRFPGGPHPDGMTLLTLEMINDARSMLGMAPIPPPAPAAMPAEPVEPVASTQDFAPPAGSAKLFCLTFNGAPVATLEEFISVAEPLIETAFPASCASNLWVAQWGVDPESTLNSWVDREPVLVACLGYTPIAQPAGAAVTEVVTPMELAEQPVGALIVRAAAGAILSGGMSNHFSFNETGGLVINAENPPSLEQGYSMMGRIFSTEETGERLKNFSRWAQGALIAELQRFFGDTFELDALCEATERTYNTLNACLNTHIRWAHRKREALSWTHHKEVEFSTLEEPDKEWVLDQSVRYGLAVSEQRKLQSFVRTYGRPGEDAMPEPGDRATLLERLEVRSANRNFMFMLQGAWYQYRGPFEHIPNGASQVINADTRQVLDREGRASAPQTWVPVGIEVPHLRGHAATVEAGIQEARETGSPPRRSRGGNTHRANRATGEAVTPEVAQEAVAEAQEALAEAVVRHLGARNRAAIFELQATAPFTAEELEGVVEAPQVADLDYNNLPPIHVIRQALQEGREQMRDRVLHHTVEGPPNTIVVEQVVAATQRESASAMPYNDRFFNEAGALRLVDMDGYPMGMPPQIQELLDAARTEERAPEILGPMHEMGSAFTAFLEASDDYLIPF